MASRGGRRIRFADDSGLTFINYTSNQIEGFGYQQQARLHNAQRRRQERTDDLASNVIQATGTQRQTMLPEMPGLGDPLSSYARDPFSQDILTTKNHLEGVWTFVFPHSFYLPHVESASSAVCDPLRLFLEAAKASAHLYRSIVAQTVIAYDARRGNQAEEAVLRNQALILRECRHLTERYNNPLLFLSDQQFQHLFAAANSLSGVGFGMELGYDSVTFTGTLLMGTPQNRAVIQTALTQWLWIIMPRPGISLYSTEATSRVVARKIGLLLDYVQEVQNARNDKYPPHVSACLQPSTALRRLLMLSGAEHTFFEPYLGFYNICRHYVLCLVHGHLSLSSQSQSADKDVQTSSLEDLASTCLQYVYPHCLALFLWALVSSPGILETSRDILDPTLVWALKDLVIVHNVSFADQFVSWLISKGSLEDSKCNQLLDVAQIRALVLTAYPMNSD